MDTARSIPITMVPAAPTEVPWTGLGLVLGFAWGLGAAYLADLLPKRSGITLLASGPARQRRNFALLALVMVSSVMLTNASAAATDGSLGSTLPSIVMNLTFATMALSAAAIDLEHMILPNELTLLGALLALATSPFRELGLRGALFGIVAALVASLLPAFLYQKIRGHGGTGLGDTKLMLFAGAWLGVFGALFVLFASAVQSALVALVMRIAGISFRVPESVKAELEALREAARAGDEEAVRALANDPMATSDDETSLGSMRLPMGPFLVLACLEFLFFHAQIASFAAKMFAPNP